MRFTPIADMRSFAGLNVRLLFYLSDVKHRKHYTGEDH